MRKDRGKRINELMCKLRNSDSPSPKNYRRLKTLFKSSTVLEGPIPQQWEQWISIFEQFELDTSLSIKEIRDLVLEIQGQGIDSPLSTSMLTLPMIGELFVNSTKLREIRQIWQAAKLALRGPSDGAPLELEGASRDAESSFGVLKEASFERPKWSRIFASI